MEGSGLESCDESRDESRVRPRIESIDLLRGAVMVLMALDHTRDFFGVRGANPVDLAQTTVVLFFTRWITHLCAPTFFLLTGTGARLSLARQSRGELSRFLATRGVWLNFLELVVLRGLAWQFNFDYRLTMLFILWALGWAMIVLAALVWLPDWSIAGFGTALIALHNLTDGVRAASLGRLAPLWTILHARGVLINSPRHLVVVAYPLVPWVGVTAVGYVLGEVYRWEPARRRALLLRASAGLTLAFAALRAVNAYGDPLPWKVQRSAAFTVLSFLNTTKYAPSLLFLLMTLGPALLLLYAFDRETPALLRPALVYGRVPLFYFALHAAVLHLAALAVCYARYGQVHWMFQSPSPGDFPFTPPPGWGFSLGWIYFIWVCVVAALYPACRWFAGLKARGRDAWLSYL